MSEQESESSQAKTVDNQEEIGSNNTGRKLIDDPVEMAALLLKMERESARAVDHYPRYLVGSVSGVIVAVITWVFLYMLYFQSNGAEQLSIPLFVFGGILTGGAVGLAVCYWPEKNQ